MRRIGLKGLLSVGCLLYPLAAKAEELRIGAILPLSGEAAALGEACRNGIEMALADRAVEAAQVIYEDDRNSPAASVTAFQKLKRQGVDALISWSSGPGKALAPLAEQSQLPLVSIATDPEIVRERRFVVNLWVTPREEARVLLEELVRRGHTTIARVSAEQSGMLAMHRAFDELNDGKVTIAIDQSFPSDVKDFRSYLARIAAAPHVQAIFVNLYVGQTGVFARQAREMGIAVPLVNIETFEDRNEVQLSGGALIDQWYIQADDATGEFERRYRERFPQAALLSAGNCHDAALLLMNGRNTQGGIASHLHEVQDFSGAMGTFSALANNTFSLPAVVKRVTPSGFEKVSSG